MYPGFTHALKRRGVQATPSHLVDLIGGISEGVAPTMGDLFILGKATYVKRPNDEDGYQRAFLEYFLGIPQPDGLSIEDSIIASSQFKKWDDLYGGEDVKESAREFLSHMFGDRRREETQMIKDLAKEHLKKMREETSQPHVDKSHQKAIDPEEALNSPLVDTGGYTVNDDHVAELMDFSDQSTEDLEEKLRHLLENQKERHEGGNAWIGQKGNGAFGNSGFSKYGIRVGGVGRYGSARSVFGADKVGYKAATGVKGHQATNILEALKGLQLMSYQDSSKKLLNLKRTEKFAGERGYIQPYYSKKAVDKMHVALFIDNGGRSMNTHVKKVGELFAKMRSHLKSLDTFYFHNCVYEAVFSDEERTNRVFLGELSTLPAETRCVVVGDAAMNPHREVNEDTLKLLRGTFEYSAWLNPVAADEWGYTESIGMINKIFPMFPLDVSGVSEAVAYLTADLAHIAKK